MSRIIWTLCLMTLVLECSTGSTIYEFQRCWNGHEVVSPRSNSTEYSIRSHHWNTRLEQVTPLAYIFPKSTTEVARAVKCGRHLRIQMIPNSGGHCYEGLSRGSNTSIVMDMSRMRGIQLIQNKNNKPTAVLQTGILVGHINAYLWKNGKYGLPMGNCMTVGIGGHAIGGGAGYYSGMFGLTIDNVLGYTMVTSEGQVVRANRFQHQDLYWALRGVGPGAIGIVTEVHVQLFEASELQLTHITARYSTRKFPEVMEGFQKFLLWAEENEPTVVPGVLIAQGKENTPQIPAFYRGIQVEVLHMYHPKHNPTSNATMRAAFLKFFPPTQGLYREEYPSYIKFTAQTGYVPTRPPLPPPEANDGTPADQLTDDQVVQYLEATKKEGANKRYFKQKGFFVSKTFSKMDFERVGRVLNHMPRENLWILMGPFNGAVWKVKPNAMSFPHRNSLYYFSTHYEGSSDQEDVRKGMGWMTQFWKAIQFMDDGGTYQNYPDVDVKNYLWRFYKSNLHRLEHVKRRWDPQNYFRNGMSIPV